MLIWPAVTLRWPCHGLEVTPLKSTTPTHVLRFDFFTWNWSIDHWSKHGHHFVIWPISDRDDISMIWQGMTSLTQKYPCNLLGMLGIHPCWGLAIMGISSEQNWSRNNKNLLYLTLLYWFDFAVTLLWPWDDLAMTLGNSFIKLNPLDHVGTRFGLHHIKLKYLPLV